MSGEQGAGQSSGAGGGEAGRQRMPLPQVMALAEQHRQAGRLAAAEDLCRQVLRARPSHTEAIHLLGIIAHQAGNTAAAIELVRRAIALDGAVALYHSNLGEMCRLAGRLEEALEAGKRAVALRPDSPEALSNLGVTRYDRDEYDEAVACHERAVALAPDFAQAHSNLGNALRAKRRYEEAIASYRRALEVKPNYADAWANLGSTLHLAGRYEEAMASFRRAIANDASQANAHAGLGMLLLLHGNFADGWPEYEWRWRSSEMPSIRLPGPQWQGEDLQGRRLLVYAEQGFGDSLHFCRYVPLLRDKGAAVTLRLPSPLAPLLANSMPWALISTARDVPVGSYDYHCPLLSIPRILATRLENIPAQCPYLRPAEDAVARWRQALAAHKGFKVGFAWTGNPKQLNNPNRAIDVSQLIEHLAVVPSVRLFSLQVGERTGELKRLPPDAVVDLAPNLTDFGETAAAIEALDLVITTDTSVPHLAGAIGKPVWVLISLIADWRWMLDREDSPWYPTMRLFRQRAAGQWEEVLGRVVDELKAVAGGARERLTPYARTGPTTGGGAVG